MDTKVAKITRSWTSPVISSPTTSLFGTIHSRRWE